MSFISQLTPTIFPYVVSDDIDQLQVEYEGGVKVASLGQELKPAQCLQLPRITYPGAVGAAFYTLVLTDPDAPSREAPTMKEWLHLKIGNIKGEALQKGELGKDAVTVWEYIGPAPPEGSGLHRYVFILYKQKGKQSKESFGSPKGRTANGRGRQSISAWAKNKGLGNAVALQAFQAQWDESVAGTYASLK